MNSTAGRNVWILGGTSAIAQAYARRKAAQGGRLLLLGLNEDHLKANAADLVARGGSAAIEVLDLAAQIDCAAAVGEFIEQHGFPDEVLIAYGILGDQERALTDLAHAADIINVNFTSVALWLLAICAKRDAAAAADLGGHRLGCRRPRPRQAISSTALPKAGSTASSKVLRTRMPERRSMCCGSSRASSTRR